MSYDWLNDWLIDYGSLENIFSASDYLYSMHCMQSISPLYFGYGISNYYLEQMGLFNYHCMTESTIECVNILLNRSDILVHTFVNYQQCFYPHEWLSINHYFPLCLNLSNWFQGTHLFYKSHWLWVLVALNMEHSLTEMFLLLILSL